MQALLHTHDTPGRTAAALALGVAIGFSPFLGLHIVIGTALAFLFNLHRVAVLIGVVSNVPWIIGPYYAAATALGAWLTRTPMPPNMLAQLRGQLADVFRRGPAAAADNIGPDMGHVVAEVGHVFRP